MKKEDVQPEWWLVDADGEILGRLASRIAMILMGKHKPKYTPHVDTGDAVVVVNAEKVSFSGTKRQKKGYVLYSGYIGGLKEITLDEMMKKNPVNVIKLAVRRMLPKNKLGKKMLKKLWVYTGIEHPHGAQQPKSWDNLWIKKRMV